jgi:hypothetical protein
MGSAALWTARLGKCSELLCNGMDVSITDPADGTTFRNVNQMSVSYIVFDARDLDSANSITTSDRFTTSRSLVFQSTCEYPTSLSSSMCIDVLISSQLQIDSLHLVYSVYMSVPQFAFAILSSTNSITTSDSLRFTRSLVFQRTCEYPT